MIAINSSLPQPHIAQNAKTNDGDEGDNNYDSQ
jgi:hypothetical protein